MVSKGLEAHFLPFWDANLDLRSQEDFVLLCFYFVTTFGCMTGGSLDNSSIHEKNIFNLLLVCVLFDLAFARKLGVIYGILEKTNLTNRVSLWIDCSEEMLGN